MIRDGLIAAGRDDLVGTAEVLISEIVSNALVHAGTEIEVAYAFVGGGLRIEVTDGSPHVPAPRAYGPSAGTGRGLILLEEMADAWGVEPGDPGKTVWFTLACDEALDPARAEPAEAAIRGRAETVSVHLLDVPLLLHEAWRQHAESMLREYLLVSLELESDEDPVTVHADASDAIALLAEHIPPSGVRDDADHVMVAATEPYVSGRRIEVPVPVTSVPHFATLDRAMRAALAMVDDGRFLTPPIQPELRALRDWICVQVQRQSQGAQAVPWRPQDEPPKGLVLPLLWETARVTSAETALVAADDTDRIVAVSSLALEILGYTDSAELVGSRLVSIIPTRYRQAHLAGFTLHFLTGRAPLMRGPVTVPVLRNDGSEVDVGLRINTERTEDDRTVFVATLSAPPHATL
jgi:PAS domain S-box-containing protein